MNIITQEQASHPTNLMRGAVALAKPLLEKECNLNVAKANVNLLVVETIVLNMIILMEMLSLFNTSTRISILHLCLTTSLKARYYCDR
jgi:hypothetical protein